MGTIRFASPENTPYIVRPDVVTEEQRTNITEDTLKTKVRHYQPGSDTELQMFEVTMLPNLVGPQHAHEESEIIYVLAGEMIFGRRVLTPGCSVYIPGRTLYKFDTGPEGVTFLNFRRRHDLTYYTAADMIERRAAKPPSS